MRTSMSTVQPRLMTADEFYEWANRPENEGQHFELERGEVVEMPPPGELHGAICAIITHLLLSYAIARQRGYVCSNDTGLLVEEDPDTLRGPDLMFFDEPLSVDNLRPQYATRIPKLIVEVLSPSDQAGRTNRRIDQYLRRGVAWIWLVDPDLRCVTVYRPGEQQQVLEEQDELQAEDVLPSFRCRVADLFALPQRKQ